MSARARQSTASMRQSTVSPSDTAAAAARDLPPYEPPENPLNIHGQRTLHNILKDHQHAKLEQHLRQAAQALNDNANTLNYRLTDRRARDAKRREKYGDALTDVDEQRHAHLEAFDVKVTAMTKRMEEAVRKTIDGQSFAGALQEELEHVERLAVSNAASASQRMATQTQRQQHHNDDDDDDDEMTNYDATLPGETQRGRGGAAVQPIVPKDVFEERYQAQRDKYQNLSLPTRYSEHPDYVGFKKAVHDGTFPNGEGPPLAPASAWFTSAGAPAPGLTQTGGGGAAGGGGGDSDDDVAVAYERISTKCPLTLLELREPITSTKCPHTFEQFAIAEMLQGSNAWTGRRGARDGVRTVQCPMPGCDKMLTHKDLRPDAALIRRIRRIQKKRMEDSDDEGGDNSHVQVIPSDDVDGDSYDDIDEAASQRVVPKVERFSGVVSGRPPPPRAASSELGSGGMGYDGVMDNTMQSTIVDMGSDSEDED